MSAISLCRFPAPHLLFSAVPLPVAAYAFSRRSIPLLHSMFSLLIFDRLFTTVMKTTLPHIFKPLLPVLLVLLSCAAIAQDPQFSQHYANRIYYNPAFTGAQPGLRFAASYRNQWPELPSDFVTYSVSVDFQAPCLNSGLGLILMQDTEGEGALSTLTAGISYAYILRIRHKNREKGNISFGVSAKYVRKWLPNDLLFRDQLDPIHGAVAEASILITDNIFYVSSQLNIAYDNT